MSTDRSPWDLAMGAIAATGCECFDCPDDVGIDEHTCVAGRCEHALLIERARAEAAEAERDALRKRIDEGTVAWMWLSQEEGKRPCVVEGSDSVPAMFRAEVHRVRIVPEEEVTNGE